MTKPTGFWVEPTPLAKVNLTPTRIEDIYQCISVILSTFEGEVMLDRKFGIDPNIIDAPMAVAQQRIKSDVVAKIHRFEPRVRVRKVQAVNIGTAATAAGTLAVRVYVEIREENAA